MRRKRLLYSCGLVRTKKSDEEVFIDVQTLEGGITESTKKANDVWFFLVGKIREDNSGYESSKIPLRSLYLRFNELLKGYRKGKAIQKLLEEYNFRQIKFMKKKYPNRYSAD